MIIETLTEKETAALARGDALDRDGRKALRIIDALTARVAELEARVSSLQCPEDAFTEGEGILISNLRAEVAHLHGLLDAKDRSLEAPAVGCATPRANTLQAHGLDPAEIDVDSMFQEPATLPCVECKSPTSNWHQTNLSAPRMYLCLGCERLGCDQPEAE